MATTAFTRTISSASAITKFTLSMWVKRGVVSADYPRLFTANGGTGDVYLRFNNDDTLEWSGHSSNASSAGYLITNRVFRDTAAWYHIVVKVDTTQSTASDRLKLYVNGVQETSFATETLPNEDATDNIVNTSKIHRIGGNDGSANSFFDGLMTHVIFTQGYAYDASTFGEFDSTSGIWKPKASPSVTYGTNGFFLKYEDSSTMGTDSSGNTNTFTTAGTPTQNIDTPSNNFVTMNPLDNYYTVNTFTNGNTTVTTPNSGYSGAIGAMGASKGKWYFEFKPVSKTGDADEYAVGITGESVESINQPHWKMATGYEYIGQNGNVINNDSSTSYGNTYTAGDIIGVAMDLDNNKLYFSKNGTFQNSGVPTSGSTGTGAISLTAPGSTKIGFYLPCCAFASNSYGAVMAFNFGSGYFGTTAVSSGNADANGYGSMEYTVPTGYYTMCTKNIKEFG